MTRSRPIGLFSIGGSVIGMDSFLRTSEVPFAVKGLIGLVLPRPLVDGSHVYGRLWEGSQHLFRHLPFVIFRLSRTGSLTLSVVMPSFRLFSSVSPFITIVGYGPLMALTRGGKMRVITCRYEILLVRGEALFMGFRVLRYFGVRYQVVPCTIISLTP